MAANDQAVKVSVIIPVYNAAVYISECLNSVLQQCHQDLEILLVDDGSTDHSVRVIKSYQDKRIKLICSANKGVSSARNIGIRASTGNYLFFLDADDSLPETAISELVEALRINNSDISIGSYVQFSSASAELEKTIYPDNRTLDRNAIFQYICQYLEAPNKSPLFVFSWGRLYSADLIKNNQVYFNEHLSTFEDVQFNLDLLKFIDNISYTPKIVYRHRLHPLNKSATTQWKKSPEELFGFVAPVLSCTDLLKDELGNVKALRLVEQCLCSYTIIQLIRLCGGLKLSSFYLIYRYIKQLVNTDWLVSAIQNYKAAAGNSTLIPAQIARRRPLMVLIACYLHARKRYR
ncbi:glycosyltransferase family 2 protein [Neptuniibacter halophilus]|uniref:glycosyltransferase family 2 protein n=1 Tax=Neptuniibacter halophilus TaxID=651666 RepID=UPI0025743F6F|nr:glycosyltransferase family 2 protein [Neptuniibacter halophilus]